MKLGDQYSTNKLTKYRKRVQEVIDLGSLLRSGLRLTGLGTWAVGGAIRQRKRV